MRAAIAIAVVLIAGGARADECDVLAARVVERTGATVTKRVDDLVQFHHPVAKLTMRCLARRSSIDVFRDEGFPPPAYFDLIGIAGSVVVGRMEAEIRADALRCQALALKAADGNAYFDRAGYQMNCDDRAKPAPGMSDFGVFGK